MKTISPVLEVIKHINIQECETIYNWFTKYTKTDSYILTEKEIIQGKISILPIIPIIHKYNMEQFSVKETLFMLKKIIKKEN